MNDSPEDERDKRPAREMTGGTPIISRKRRAQIIEPIDTQRPLITEEGVHIGSAEDQKPRSLIGRDQDASPDSPASSSEVKSSNPGSGRGKDGFSALASSLDFSD